MSIKEVLDNVKLMSNFFEDKIYLVIPKKNTNGEILETKGERELTNYEIINTIFYLSRFYLKQHKENTHTFYNSKEYITISIKKKD